MRDELLRKYSENLKQLDRIVKLSQDLNKTCAQQSIEARMSFDDIEKFITLTKTAFNEITVFPSWKIVLKYPKYWHLAEAHTRYFAPNEVQLQDAIKEIGQSTAP